MPPEDVCGISRNFSRLSPCEGQVAYALLTRAPVADRSVATPSLPLDLHVLSLSLAFILSQDQTLRCLSCFYFFSVIPTARPTTSDRPGICALFSLDGGLPPSSFVLSLYRIISMFSAPFPFRKAVTKVLPLFLTAKFFANFFQVSFPEPRVRAGPTPSGITLKPHDHRSVSLLRLQRYCLLPFPPNFSASFFAPFFNIFHNILILRHLFRKLFSLRFPSFATETSPNYLHTLLYI